MPKRIIFNLIFIAAIFYAPWYLVLFVAFVGAFVFQSYYEIIIAGIIFDILYGTNLVRLWGMCGLVVSVALFLITRKLKTFVR